MQAKSPKEARQIGLKTYFTGIPCKRGGIAERKLNSDCLCDACVIFTKQLKASWSSKNKSKNTAWRKANPEKMVEYQRKYVERNKLKIKERLSNWKRNNPDKVSSDTRKRQSSKINAVPKWYGEFDSFVNVEAIKLSKLREVATGIKWHVDHMIPLQAKVACGLHCASNLQVIPERLNCVKRNEMMYTEPYEWIRCA